MTAIAAAIEIAHSSGCADLSRVAILPDALDAMPLAMGKATFERPALRLLARDPSSIPARAPGTEDWALAAADDVERERLDARSRALLALKLPGLDLEAAAAELARVAAIDGVRKEHVMHRRIREWMAAEGASLPSAAELEARIYDELFRTPARDPWLGLRGEALTDLVELER